MSEPDMNEPDMSEPDMSESGTARTARTQRGPRGWSVTAGYALSAVAAVALVVATVALPSQVPHPTPRTESIQPVDLEPGDLTLVCPGAPVLPTSIGGGDVSYDSDLGTGTGDITLRQQILPLDGARLDQPAIVGSSGPRVVTVTPAPGQSPRAVGLTSGYTASGDLRGLVAATCQVPTSSAWFVGGDTEIGSSTQLVLTNPGQAPVKVSVQGWTVLGPMPAPHTELLPPGETVLVLLETLERSPRVAVHVRAEGGRIAAHLQTSTLDGLTPMGVAYITSATPPQPDLLLGPIRIVSSDTAQDDTTQDDTTQPNPGTPVLQLLNPGQAQARVAVTLLGPDGPVDLPGAGDLILEPGTVSQLPLAAPKDGAYTVQVAADEAITGAVRTAAVGTGSDGAPAARDIGWLPAAYPADMVVVPTLGATGDEATGDEAVEATSPTTIAVTNPTPADTEVTVVAVTADGRLGAAATMDLAARSTADVPIPTGAVAVQISSSLPVLASAELRVTTASGDLLELVRGASHTQSGVEVRVVLPGR